MPGCVRRASRRRSRRKRSTSSVLPRPVRKNLIAARPSKCPSRRTANQTAPIPPSPILRSSCQAPTTSPAPTVGPASGAAAASTCASNARALTPPRLGACSGYVADWSSSSSMACTAVAFSGSQACKTKNQAARSAGGRSATSSNRAKRRFRSVGWTLMGIGFKWSRRLTQSFKSSV